MQYMLLIYEGEEQFADQAVLADMIAKHRAFVGTLGAAFQSGSGLGGSDTATTIRTASGGSQSIHDGPFAEAREQLGGYYVIDVPDLDAALAVARQVPICSTGSVEVRPMVS
jgi:hypothetical protein